MLGAGEASQTEELGTTETWPQTVRRMGAEQVVAVVDSGEAGILRKRSSAADGCDCSLKLQGSWSSAGRPGPPAGLCQL